MRDLRAMGESNALVEAAQSFSRRATLSARPSATRALRPGRWAVGATFEADHPDRLGAGRDAAAAAAAGERTGALADALGTVERPAGDKAAPKGWG